jgi:hypothetical protein
MRECKPLAKENIVETVANAGVGFPPAVAMLALPAAAVGEVGEGEWRGFAQWLT